MKGVLDRFEENKAVILIEEENEELVIDRETLPRNSHVGTWFDIEKESGSYHITINIDLTQEKKQQASDLRAKLKAKSKGSKFKK